MSTTRVKSPSLARSEDDEDVFEIKHYNSMATVISKTSISKARGPDGGNNNNYTLENEGYGNESYEEGYGEECEYGTDVCKYKKERFQWSRSLLEEDAYPENVLTEDETKKCLSRIGQVGNGLSYAFIQIDVDHRNLTNIEEIANFRHLSIINVSHNHLDLHALDVLRDLEYVVFIQADHNAVNSLCLSPMPYLQVLTLNSNRVSSLSGLKQPSLERLELNDNKIDYLIQKPSKNFNAKYRNEIDCPNLSILALSRNVFESIEQISYNRIENLNGIANLQNLSYLNLRSNNISNLDGFTNSLNHLSYLNLRENRLNDINEIIKLTCLKSLKTLVLSYNDFNDNPITLRPKILKLLPWLKRIDKELVSVSEVKLVASNENELRHASGEELFEEE